MPSQKKKKNDCNNFRQYNGTTAMLKKDTRFLILKVYSGLFADKIYLKFALKSTRERV